MVKITITSLMSAMLAMRDDRHTHYISLIGPEESCYSKGDCHLWLEFHDTEDRDARQYIAPRREHIDKVLAFTKGLTDKDDLLIHCHAGISRSTAMAIGVACQHGMTPAEALAHIRQIREATLKPGYLVLPNRLMIEYIDDALSLGGELMKVVDEYYVGLPLIGVTTLPNRGGWNTTD